MITQIFTLTGENIQEPVSNFVRQYYQQTHECNYPGGYIRQWEDFSFWEDHDLVNTLRVDFSQIDMGIILIEMISAGAGSLEFAANSELRRLDHFTERLKEFCSEMKIELKC